MLRRRRREDSSKAAEAPDETYQASEPADEDEDYTDTGVADSLDYEGEEDAELGYGSAAAATAIAAATVAGGNTSIALSDGTKITFENITTPSSIKIFST